MDLQFEKKESADKLEVFILCPGLTKEDIAISFDKKEGVLEVNGTPKENDISKIIDLEITGKITISPKYRSEKVAAKISNGVAVLEFGLAKDVNLVEVQ
jgi:HSP20 family molecular chaperone IbpA